MEAGKIVNVATSPYFVRPDYNVPYKPMKESIEFFSWVNTMLGQEDSETPKAHYIAIDKMLGKETEVQAMMARGMAKSTVFTKYLPLYVASTGNLPNFGRVVNIAIFSATYAQAVDLMKDMKSAWETSDILQETLTLAKSRQGKNIADKENHTAFVNEQGLITHITCYGSGDQIRGKL